MLQEWVIENCWSDHYFRPDKFGTELVIYQSTLSDTLVSTIIDGNVGTPLWNVPPRRDATAVLIESLKPLVSQYGASWFYITNPDNALSIFQWEEVINSDYFNPYPLSVLETQPAAQGGVSYLSIGFHDGQGMVVFELDSELKISIHAEKSRMAEICEALKIK